MKERVRNQNLIDCRMQRKAVSKRNNSIDILRLITALYVVLPHCGAIFEHDSVLYEIFVWRFPRYAVPFFICISGYYTIKSLLEGKGTFWISLKAILKTYIVWTIIYYSLSFVSNVIMMGEPIQKFLIDRVIYFIGEGSYPHFYFFPALIYSMLITALLFKLFGKKGVSIFAVISFVLTAFGALGTVYLKFGSQIPILSDIYQMNCFGTIRGIVCMGFAYFTLGYYLNILRNRILNAKKSILYIIFGISMTVFICEMTLDVMFLEWPNRPEPIFSTYFFVGALLSILMVNPMPKLSAEGKYSKSLASFVYFVHPLLVFGISLFIQFTGKSLHLTVVYLIVIFVSLGIGLILMKWNSKIARMLLGERIQSKIKKVKRIENS